MLKKIFIRCFLYGSMVVPYLVMPILAQQKFDGIDVNLGNLYRISDAVSRSISAENFTGAKGQGGMATDGTGARASKILGQGWKVSPCVEIDSKSTFALAEIDGPGAIKHIWLTSPGDWKLLILRIYWDGEKEPSVECPVGDFFCMGWGRYSPLQSLAVAVNPGSAFNCYWTMPFHKKCKITMENISDGAVTLFYQIDYVLTRIPKDAAYFHAQYRQEKPVAYKEPYVLVDSILGTGQYVGTYIALEPHSNGWWGEGEIKFY